MGGGARIAVGRIRVRGSDRLHPVLRHQLHLHRACGGGGVPLRTVQHRGRRAGLHRGTRHGPGVPAPRLPAVRSHRARGRRRGRPVRRGLGLRAGVAPGLPRKPHRHHHHHVQFHRRFGDGPPAGQRRVPSRIDGAGEPGLRPARPASADARGAGRAGDRRCGVTAEPVLPVGAPVLCRRVAVRLAHPGRLPPEDRRRESGGGGLRRNLAAPPGGGRDARLRRPGRLHEPERADGSAAPAGARVHRRLRLCRHRGGADGPGSSRRHRPGLDPVRRALPGRGRALVRDSQDHAGHGGGDPGVGDPVRRSTGVHVRPLGALGPDTSGRRVAWSR